MVATPPTPKAAARRLLTSEEFLDWLEPGVHADFIGGEIFMHSPVNLRHSSLLNFMDRLLGLYVEHENLGELHREQLAVRLDSRTTLMPDLSYFTKAQVARLAETHAPFAPTFVLEALSSGTAERDRGPKFAAYERHNVQEYWILDPQKLDHRFYRREGELLSEFAENTERIDSSSIAGFWVKRAWLNPVALPPVARCLAEILHPRKGRTSSRR